MGEPITERRLTAEKMRDGIFCISYSGFLFGAYDVKSGKLLVEANYMAVAVPFDDLKMLIEKIKLSD